MTQGKESEAGKKRRAQIIRAATRMMSKKGYKGTSIQVVADSAGIHKSTFFHYFKNKEELLLDVLKTGIDEVTENLMLIFENKKLTPEERLEQAVTSLVAILIEHIDNVKVFHSELRYLPDKKKKQYLEKRDAYQALFRRVIDEVKASDRGYFRDMDAKLVTFGILGMCNWISRWYKKGGFYSPEEVSRVFFGMISKRVDSP